MPAHETSLMIRLRSILPVLALCGSLLTTRSATAATDASDEKEDPRANDQRAAARSFQAWIKLLDSACRSDRVRGSATWDELRKYFDSKKDTKEKSQLASRGLALLGADETTTGIDLEAALRLAIRDGFEVDEPGGAAVDTICREYCTDESARRTRLCRYADDLEFAQLAVAVDPVQTAAIVAKIQETGLRFQRVTKVPKKVRDRLADAGEPVRFDLGTLGSLPPAVTTAEGLTQVALRLATALGALAVDRAKQEAIVWTLEQLGSNVCRPKVGGVLDEPLSRELTTHWLPHVCALTRAELLQSGFGAGQAMLGALVSAVENDARGLPGAAAGAIVGLAYWSEDTARPGTEKAAYFGCTPDTDGACKRSLAVRLATSRAAAGLLDGRHPIDVARTWSSAIDSVNRVPDPAASDAPRRYTLRAPFAQLAACAVAVAAELGASDERRVLLDTAESRAMPDQYRLVAALTTAPACWTLTGGTDIERVSTALRLAETLAARQQAIATSWRALSDVIARLRGVERRLGELQTPRADARLEGAVVEALLKSKDGELKAQELRKLLDEAAVRAARTRLATSLEVAEETIAAADALAALLGEFDAPTLKGIFPGLPDETRTDLPGAETVASMRAKIQRIARAVEALRDIVKRDWTAATTRALDLLRIPLADEIAALKAELRLIAGELDKLQSPKLTQSAAAITAIVQESGFPRDRGWVELLREAARRLDPAQSAELKAKIERRVRLSHPGLATDRLVELLGLFTAVLEAEDTKDVAVALEKTASPPGGWRRKQLPGSFTLALGSHVGLFSAMEWRVGQYGVVRERGHLHAQAPTLAVPLGFDIAWGLGRRSRAARHDSVGLFVPLIDPAAFLQYDISEGGRLPGPRPLTVFSPGLMFRWGIFKTPITLLAGYVYRPRLRTWEATVNEPGADAHQLGVALAVDATIWNIVKR